MKTITLICLASLFFVCSVHSQISKGAILLGGNLGYSQIDYSDSSDDYKNHSYSINPSLGFVVKENSVFGINLSYSHSINQSGDSKGVSNNYQVGVFHRRYLPLGKSFYLYGQGQLNVGIGKQKQQTPTFTHEYTYNSIEVSAYPGLAYAISKRFHLEIALSNLIGLNYTSIKGQNSSAPDARTSQFNFHLNVNPASNLALGFRILLGNK